jgi:nucleoside-diphosphate-sugar epimerase
MPVTTLVTGSSGFLGGWVVHELRQRTSHRIKSGLRSPNSSESAHESVALDVTNLASVQRALRGVDQIVHLAGCTQADCETNPVHAHEVNVIGTRNLMSVATDYGIKQFLHVSTIQVYGSPLPSRISTETPPNPANRYAEVHLAAEAELNFDAETSLDIVRLSNGFGAPCVPAQCWHLAVNDFARQAVSNSEIRLLSNGNQQRNFVPIRSSAAFLTHLAGHVSSPGRRVWLFGSPSSQSVEEMANLVAARWELLSGQTVTVVPGSAGPSLPEQRSHLDLRPADTVGFRSEITTEAAIDALLKHCQTGQS